MDERILILYDGNCPMCRRKVTFLKRHDHNHRLRFNDISAPTFATEKVNISPQQLESQIHAQLPDGQIITRMDVVRAAWREIGLGWLAAPTGWPLLRPLFDLFYGFVAHHRMKISRLFRF